jgi:hypothetical protein
MHFNGHRAWESRGFVQAMGGCELFKVMLGIMSKDVMSATPFFPTPYSSQGKDRDVLLPTPI